jgi:hypothetical protein
MPGPSREPILFISYSQLDEPERPGEGQVRWLSFVVGHLRPAEKHGAVEIWLDRQMPGGADWEREIERKLRACDVFILLVSNHSMASFYVLDKEIAVIRERQGNGEDVHFYPLLLTPTTEIALDEVRDKNLRPRDGQPFSKFRCTSGMRRCARRRMRSWRSRGGGSSRRAGRRRHPRRWCVRPTCRPGKGCSPAFRTGW